MAVLLLCIAIPWIVPVGPLNMPTYRFALLVMLVPSLLVWARTAEVRAADLCVIGYAAWCAVSLVKAHGMSTALEPAGVVMVETLGAYFIARSFIRTVGQFRATITFAVVLIVVLIPFALVESMTGSKPLLTLFGSIFPTVEPTLMQPRAGFFRVQGPFDHSILFGAFCGSMFALTYLGLADTLGPARRVFASAAVAFAALMSLSSAPLGGLILQILLVGWNSVLRSFAFRWKLLWTLVLTAYLVVEFGSNQTPVAFYISKFTFDGSTGWYRLLIWEFGSASVADHPLFGIGLGDWARPRWMASDSVDNFWLLTAMRFGLPALFLLAASIVAVLVGVMRHRPSDEELERLRLAYLICLSSFIFVGCTVHFWGGVYVWFMLLLGSAPSGLAPVPVVRRDSTAPPIPAPSPRRRATA